MQYVMVCYGKVWYVMMKYATIRCLHYDNLCYDMVRYDVLRYDNLCYDMVRYDVLCYDVVQYDVLRFIFVTS